MLGDCEQVVRTIAFVAVGTLAIVANSSRIRALHARSLSGVTPEPILQASVNVLKNAMESIGEDGRIGLRLVSDGERPVLAIADTGPGIPEDVRPLLFTPFFSTKRDGRGLGLTLIREILTAHGAGFGLENRPEGGAEFRVRF